MLLHPLLAHSLRRYKRLQKFFNSLSASTRNDFDHFIRSVKKGDTRLRRVQQTIELLTEVMEAELDPPPLIHHGLRPQPQSSTRLGTHASITAPAISHQHLPQPIP